MATNYDDFDDFDDSPEVHQNPNPNQKKHKGKANGFLKFMLQYRREKGLNMNQCQEQAGELWEVSKPSRNRSSLVNAPSLKKSVYSTRK